MASISSITNNTGANSTGGSKGIAGLATGMDTDSMVEKMTYYTRMKISAQKQKLTAFGWQQNAYRSVSDKLVEFARKYTDFSSTTGMGRSSFWTNRTITALGENASKVGVSGQSSSRLDVSVLGVKQTAKNATYTSDDALTTSGSIESAGIDVTKEYNVSTLEGQSMTVKFGDTYFQLDLAELPRGEEYTNINDVAKALNDSIKEQMLKDKPLSDLMEVKAVDGKLKFETKGGNSLQVIEGSDENILGILGFRAEQKATDGVLEGGAVIASKFSKKMEFSSALLNKTMTFNYNGISKTIKFNDLFTDGAHTSGADGIKSNADFQAMMQEKLDKEFGAGRIKVGLGADDGNGNQALTFETTKTDGTADPGSTLAVSSMGLNVGKLMGLDRGASTKLNLSCSILTSGLSSTKNLTNADMQDLTINGVKIEGLTTKSTVNEIMTKINSSDADVKVSYSSLTGKFTMASTKSGENSEVDVEGVLGKALFGYEETVDSTGNTVVAGLTKGRDAIVKVHVDGEDIEMIRDSNSIDINGLSITLKEEFGYDAAGVFDPTTEAVTFSGKSDVDKMYTSIQEMVDDYNEIVELITKESGTKPDNKYRPLTDEQRADMSESEIKTWEDKAKEGLLFNDGVLNSLAQELRFVFSGCGVPINELEEMGISVATDAEANGKITLNETKLKAALDADPEKVKSAFISSELKNGKMSIGIMDSMKKVGEKYAATTGATKGILIEKAGSKYSALSLLKNTMTTQMQDTEKLITNLNAKLKVEQTRYYKQFSNLEVAVSKMNNQSSWLWSSMGG